MATVLDIGVDLGTASVVIYGKGKGVVLNEEYVKTLSKEDREIADQINRRTEFQVIDTSFEY